MKNDYSGSDVEPDYACAWDEAPDADLDHLIDPDHPAYDRRAAVAQVRRDLWNNGFRPVPVFSHDVAWLNPKCRGKQPVGDGWQNSARANPPASVSTFPSWDELNTGIMCDGLRAIDIDIKGLGQDDVARSVYRVVVRQLGESTYRFRADSTSKLCLYRAAEGEPSKLICKGIDGMQVEVLGLGQQCVVHGTYVSGKDLLWRDGGPLTIHRDDLPTVTEPQIRAMLDEIGLLIGADIVQEQIERERAERVAKAEPPYAGPLDQTASVEDLASAIAVLKPDNGYDTWVNVLAGLFNATSGSRDGLALAHQYSQKGQYDRASVDAKWRSLRSSPMRGITAGTIFHMAREADPSWISPSYQAKARTQAQESASYHTKQESPHDPVTGEILEATTVQNNDLGDLFPVLTVAQAKALPPPRWLIPDLITENSLTVLYAPSASLKSFLTVNVGMHLAYGQPWLGMPTRKVGVAYVAAEGAAGLGKRVEAWERHHGRLDAHNLFRIIPTTVNILDGQEVDRCIRTVQAQERASGCRFSLVIIDTLARAMVGGDENGPQDMSLAVAGAGRIQAALNCAVILVHHTGKDVGRGARGHYSLTAAADTMLAVTRDEMRMCVCVVKQKDSEDGHTIKFQAEKVILSERDGQPCSSLVLVHDGSTDADEADAKVSSDGLSIACAMSDGERLSINALCKRLAATTKISANSAGYDRIKAAIPLEGITQRTATGVHRIWRTETAGGQAHIHCAGIQRPQFDFDLDKV